MYLFPLAGQSLSFLLPKATQLDKKVQERDSSLPLTSWFRFSTHLHSLRGKDVVEGGQEEGLGMEVGPVGEEEAAVL